jgi:hypothetical protein
MHPFLSLNDLLHIVTTINNFRWIFYKP